MSRRISHEEDAGLKIHSGKYAAQWQHWGDGNIWALTPGQDFTESVAAFRAHCYYMARRVWGVRVRTSLKGGIFYVQIDPPVVDPQPENVLAPLVPSPGTDR